MDPNLSSKSYTITLWKSQEIQSRKQRLKWTITHTQKLLQLPAGPFLSEKRQMTKKKKENNAQVLCVIIINKKLIIRLKWAQVQKLPRVYSYGKKWWTNSRTWRRSNMTRRRPRRSSSRLTLTEAPPPTKTKDRRWRKSPRHCLVQWPGTTESHLVQSKSSTSNSRKSLRFRPTFFQLRDSS